MPSCYLYSHGIFVRVTVAQMGRAQVYEARITESENSSRVQGYIESTEGLRFWVTVEDRRDDKQQLLLLTLFLDGEL